MDKLVDPIKEADVYLAYGRRAQAVQILESALANDPSRDDVKLKLAEIAKAPQPPTAISQNQQIIVFVLLAAAAALKFFVDDPRFNLAGSVVGFCAILYLCVCLVSKRRA